MYFVDTETCGLHGVAVLLQYADGDGEVKLWDIWKEPISDTITLIEDIADKGIIGFNLAFDWFHLYKLWTMFSMFPDQDAYPDEVVDQLGELEPRARDYSYCLKPRHAFDIMLHARKGPYQNTMDRNDVRVRRVPTAMATKLAQELDSRIPLNDIYFARRKVLSGPKWKVYDIKNEFDEVDPDFKDVVLKFAPSSALKALAVDALGIKQDLITLFTDVEVDHAFRPIEYGYAPFAKAGVIDPRYGRLLPTGPGQWRRTWPDVIEFHIEHWAYNKFAREYATNDVIYTRNLYKFFGSPDVDDNDSTLACMVANCRWRGYAIDKEGIQNLRVGAIKKSKSAPKDPTKVKKYIMEKMSDVEKLIITRSTKKQILEEIAESWGDHPAADRAREVLAARAAQKQIEIYDKLLMAGRLHASFVVVGTLSTRMAGSDGLNPQGINKTKEVRKQFPLAHKGMILCGGDFDAFEVTLAEAVYNDSKLRDELLKGMKIHALFGKHIFSHMTYEEIWASSGTDNDYYKKSKSGFFALIYGGTIYTLQTRLGVSEEDATEGYNSFERTYKGVAAARMRIFNDFCSMRQPGGIGTKVEWHDPKDYIESFLGFRRYFTLENQIAKVLYDLGNNPPTAWKDLKIKVVRRDREQTMFGATQSACYGAAFAVQAANMRAAGNHIIQSPGAQITKELQGSLWSLQPSGKHKWLVQPLNVHDEVMCPSDPSVAEQTKETVNKHVESFRDRVPLIKMIWKTNLKNWGE